MAHAVTSPAGIVTAEEYTGALPKARVPWEVWCGALAVTSSTLGLEWDISWHVSIGRDTFWTPAHLMIYFCGVLTALVCGYLVLATTFGKLPELRRKSVGVFGFHAPLGCFIATWGGLAMLLSAPFDNWWHAAYGLDVQVLSPPHTLLGIGLNMVSFGFLLLNAGAMNRAAAASDGTFPKLQALFLYTGGLITLLMMIVFSERLQQSNLHSSSAYKILGFVFAFMLPFLSQGARHRWAATWAVLVYCAIRIATILIFPLVHATPKLGPVVTPVTHLIPSQFPVLILVPAMLLDSLWAHTEAWRALPRAIVSGIVFMASILVVEWPFASFLMTKASQNRFFGTAYRGFQTLPADRIAHFSFLQSGWQLAHGLVVATIYAIGASWVGLRLGTWMRSVQR